MNELPASTTKRLLAIIYDSLLLVAVLFLAMAFMLLIRKGESSSDGDIFTTLYLLLVSYVFFTWFWRHGGQTLGMRAWKLQVISTEGESINFKQSFIRFITALPAWIVVFIGTAEISGIQLVSHKWLEAITRLPDGIILGFGLLWLWFDQRPDNWRDRFSQTRIMQLEKNPRKNNA